MEHLDLDVPRSHPLNLLHKPLNELSFASAGWNYICHLYHCDEGALLPLSKTLCGLWETQTGVMIPHENHKGGCPSASELAVPLPGTLIFITRSIVTEIPRQMGSRHYWSCLLCHPRLFKSRQGPQDHLTAPMMRRMKLEERRGGPDITKA